jgi:hypothetical protein
MIFLQSTVRKLLTMGPFPYLSVQPGLYSKGLAQPYCHTKYELGMYTHPFKNYQLSKFVITVLLLLINVHEHAYSYSRGLAGSQTLAEQTTR